MPTTLKLTGGAASDPHILADLDAPACKRLISRTYFPREVVALIEVIFARKDEIKTMRELRGDDVQTFIDMMHGVRFTLLPFRARDGYQCSRYTLDLGGHVAPGRPPGLISILSPTTPSYPCCTHIFQTPSVRC